MQVQQQQAALMASVGQGGYLSPMAAFAAAQMQHMATINGLPGGHMTPTSGEGSIQVFNFSTCKATMLGHYQLGRGPRLSCKINLP